MQASQRVEGNLALEYAILKANSLNKPLVVFFGLTKEFPEANFRHFHFMIEGLREVTDSLENAGIKFIVWNKSPSLGVVELSKEACLCVVDKGYLKTQKQWYTYAANHMDCPLIQIEDNIIVPVNEASPKEEYSAATLRPKIEKKLQTYLTTFNLVKPKYQSINLPFESIDLQNTDNILSKLNVANSDYPVRKFRGGTKFAIQCLNHFIKEQLFDYKESRNDPVLACTSDMSPYLHFGQISPLQIVLLTESNFDHIAQKEAFFEELIIRRELAINYMNYNPNYDSFEGLPNWTKNTLTIHQIDERKYHYDLDDLENAKTHDIYWNAAQKEMFLTGKMHGYMRMYWGKKIIEWTKNPQDAFKIALYLNNKYELDGRDPNSYAGVAWCFGKHDRPWKERAIFGMVRYMNDQGLKRKFNIDTYVKKIQQL
ncbi:MAG: deoxyribodipyrimidine photolyase [Crenarchaeota archaeon]|nr:deoxyribodipyrimidine photolyase [Thermoproteota archaeon]